MKRLFRTPWIARIIFSGRTWGFSSPDVVYLTFDDGPTSELTAWILEYLRKEEVHANFFCVGENARSLPQLMEDIRNDGHVIGNHTMRHDKGTKIPFSDYSRSIDEASVYTSSTLFRPPYGRMPASFTRKLKKNYKIVMWSWLSYDYDPSVPVKEILEEAENIRPGDILVMHDNAKVQERLKEILPAIIQIVKNKGLKFGLISF